MKYRSEHRTILNWVLAIMVIAAPSIGRAFYNPEQGRWLSRDPIGEPAAANLFVFVQNNPITQVDRAGLDIFVPYPGYPGPYQPRCRRTCKEICADARKNPKMNKNEGGVFCENGLVCPCVLVMPSNAKEGQCPILEEIITLHELIHINYVPVKCDPTKKSLYRVGYASPAEEKKNECLARWFSYQQLNGIGPQSATWPTECKLALNHIMNSFKDYLKNTCGLTIW